MNSISKLIGSIAALIAAVSLFWMAVNVNKVIDRAITYDGLKVKVRQDWHW